jgi:hypothetical protein
VVGIGLVILLYPSITEGINNDDYDHIGKEKIVLNLYKQGKKIRNIAKKRIRMSLRDISIILRKNQVNHGTEIIDDALNII